MARFDRVIIVDWSAANAPSPPRESADAIWIGIADSAGVSARYIRTRAEAEAQITALIEQAKAAGERALIGFDFPLGYPAGFAKALTGSADVRGIWQYLRLNITDTNRNENNRFDIANTVNAQFGAGPFWGHPHGMALSHLPARKLVDYSALPFAERRVVETLIPRAQPVWKLYTTGSVGSQSLMGLPMIARLAEVAGVAVWPFDRPETPVLLAEVYPSLMGKMLDPIKDRGQVTSLAKTLHALTPDQMAGLLTLKTAATATEEGWILGAGYAPLMMP